MLNKNLLSVQFPLLSPVGPLCQVRRDLLWMRSDQRGTETSVPAQFPDFSKEIARELSASSFLDTLAFLVVDLWDIFWNQSCSFSETAMLVLASLSVEIKGFCSAYIINRYLSVLIVPSFGSDSVRLSVSIIGCPELWFMQVCYASYEAIYLLLCAFNRRKSVGISCCGTPYGNITFLVSWKTKSSSSSSMCA